MSHTRKKIILMLLVIASVSGAAHLGNKMNKARKHRHSGDVYAPLVPYMNITETDSFDTKMDKIRRFVHGHSAHQIDDDFYKIQGNDRLIAARFMDKITGDSKTGPHLECSSRSGVMQKILRYMGYNVRGVIGFKYEPGYRSHVFLKVQNPDTGQWQVQDPDYDVSWRIVASGAHASAADLFKMDYNSFEPCLTDKQCGWDIVNNENMKAFNIRRSLALAVTTERDNAGNSHKSAMVNTKRFYLDKAPEGSADPKPFCTAMPKYCRQGMTRF